MVIINKKRQSGVILEYTIQILHLLSCFYQRYRKWRVCFTQFLIKTLKKKPEKIVTLFADKGFWQYSAIPSKKFILSLLTFRNSLEILLWSCRSRFYKETYVYNYNSLVGEIPLPAYVPLNGPPLNVWVTSPFWLRYPNHSPCLGSENCKQREKLF